MQAGALGGMFHSGPAAGSGSGSGSASPPAGGCSGGGSSMAAAGMGRATERNRRRPTCSRAARAATASRERAHPADRVSRELLRHHLGAEAAGGHRDEAGRRAACPVPSRAAMLSRLVLRAGEPGASAVSLRGVGVRCAAAGGCLGRALP